MARVLDLVSGHTVYRRASLIDLYLHARFHWNRTTFCGWKYVRTYICTDGWMYGRTFETSFIRL